MLHDLPAGLTEWLQPRDIDDALCLVSGGATPVGGGAALLSRAFPLTLGARAVDVLSVLPRGLEDGLLGASTTLAALARDPGIRASWPAIAAAAASTATPQVRNVATLGGTVAARLPTSDLAAALAAHDSAVQLLTPDGVTWMDVVDYLGHPAWPAHLVLGVQPRRAGAGSYRRFARQIGPAPAIATVAAVTAGDELRLFAGAVGPTAAPLRLTADGGVDGEVRSDARASADYRRQLIRVLAAEVIAELTARRPGPRA